MGQSYKKLSLLCLATLHGPTTQHCLCEAEKPLLHSWYHVDSLSTTSNITILGDDINIDVSFSQHFHVSTIAVLTLPDNRSLAPKHTNSVGLRVKTSLSLLCCSVGRSQSNNNNINALEKAQNTQQSAKVWLK